MITKIKAFVKEFFREPTYEEDCREAIRTLDERNEKIYQEAVSALEQERKRQQEAYASMEVWDGVPIEKQFCGKPVTQDDIAIPASRLYVGKLHLPENAMYDSFFHDSGVPYYQRLTEGKVINYDKLKIDLFKAIFVYPHGCMTSKDAKELAELALQVFTKHIGE
jgi:hypothetical protein